MPIDAILRSATHTPVRPSAAGPRCRTRQREDERFLQGAKVNVQIAPAPAEVEHGIADELPRPVVRGLAAAMDRLDRIRQRSRGHQAGAVRRAADGVNRLVLEQQERIRRPPGSAIFAAASDSCRASAGA